MVKASEESGKHQNQNDDNVTIGHLCRYRLSYRRRIFRVLQRKSVGQTPGQKPPGHFRHRLLRQIRCQVGYIS